MASTSSSIANASTCKFDVFINHHGIDVKNSLASTIYHTLDLMRVRAFLDREELEAGEKISNAIEEAISDALVHIAIFSPNYAQSSWCLEELTVILRTGKKIIPIFYNVEPCDLRWVAQGRGVYAEEFSKHENRGRYPPQKLEEWKKALSEVSEISGYVHNQPDNDEGLMLKNIINDVIAEMRNKPLLDVATHPVGLDEAIKDFQKFVETQSQCADSRDNVKIMGITGLGGSGKTTLVKEYFNQKRSYYTQSSFLSDVRDAAAKNRLYDLQKQLREDLKHSKEEILNTSASKGTLERSMLPVKTLIVLDDVDHINQIEALLKRNLQPNSLVIVTTRDSSVIISSGSLSRSVSVFVYKKRALDPVHAKQLFCWHAFLRDSPEKGFEDLVEEFLSACQGLPLSLKVLGAQLFGNNNRDYWEFVLHKISKISPEDIKQTLKVSYDALDKEHKQIFLDIACFFSGEQKDMAISIWDGSSSDGVLWSSGYGFQILANKCLVEVDHENYIRMHDHLRDLGREVAAEKKPSRFWSHSQCINSQRPRLLEERLPVRGIMAATGSYGYGKLHYESPFEECMGLLMGHSTSRYTRLTSSALGLQLLAVRGNYFKEQFGKLSEDLVWLRWYDFPYEKIPSWLSTGKLRVLELYQPQRLTELWGPNDAPPSQLRELIIHSSDFCNLRMIPQTIGFLKHLKKIVLKGYGVGLNESKISSLPEEFCLLESLEHLELVHFSYLSSLPTNFGNLRNLGHINFSGCHRLTSLPASLGNLSSLIRLEIKDCPELKYFPSVENLSCLIQLRISDCRKLTYLPPVECLTRLENLKLIKSGVEYLEGFGKLVNLQKLEISFCPIREMPLANPEERYSKKPRLLNHVDSSMFRCPRLKSIVLVETKVSTVSISEDCCPSLEDLRLEGNDDLMEIETLPTTLKRVSIRFCRKLKNIRCFAGLAKLHDLEILCCPWLDELPSFSGLVELQRLCIQSCPIRGFRLGNPEERYSKKPRRYPKKHRRYSKKPRLLNPVKSSMFKFMRPKRIRLCGTKVSTISKPRRYYKKPRLLDRVDSSVFKCPRLKSIVLSGTEVSTVSISADCCPSLEDLSLNENDDLMEIKTLPTTLKSLVIRSGYKLTNIRCVAGLLELRHLEIGGSYRQLHKLPSFAGLLKLRHLEIEGCPELDELPSFACCTCLENLKIYVSSRNTKIDGKLKNLEKLNRLQIRAKSRSAIERCIPPNILKRPCRMEIMGRPVEDVESVVDSFSFPNFTVVDELLYTSGFNRWEMKARLSNASCMIACFVISCRFDGCSLFCRVLDDTCSSRIQVLKGKQVCMVVLPEGFDFNDMESIERVIFRLGGIFVQIEKGKAVIIRKGEEEKASYVLHKFLELLEP